MSKDNLKSIKPDHRVKTAKKAAAELSEAELEKVSGGDGATQTASNTSSPSESLSLNFTKIEMKYH